MATTVESVSKANVTREPDPHFGTERSHMLYFFGLVRICNANAPVT